MKIWRSWRKSFFEIGEGYLHNYGLQVEDVITPLETTEEMGSIAVLKGNLAPEGAVVKYSACEKSMRSHKGRAVVFDCEEDAHAAVVNNEINPGEILVIRYEGPRGSGMPEMLMTTEAIVCDHRLNGHVSLITDGQVFRCHKRCRNRATSLRRPRSEARLPM